MSTQKRLQSGFWHCAIGLILAALLSPWSVPWIIATTTQIRSAIVIGWLYGGTGAVGTLALNTATTYIAFSLRLSETKTLNKVLVYCSAVNGTLDGNDLTLDVFDSSAGSPGTSLSSTATVTATPTGAAWVEFTGLTQSLTAGKFYWLVLKNAAVAPTVDYPTYQWTAIGNLATYDSVGANFPWSKKSTTDGSTWGTTATGAMGTRLEFSDGSFDGIPTQNFSNNASADGVYNTREVGSCFTMPTNASINVRGVAMFINDTGTPTAQPRLRLYSGSPPSSLLATTNDIATAEADFTAIALHVGYFSAIQNLTGGNAYCVTLGEGTQTDTSGNRYNTVVFTIHDSAASKALTPFGGTQKTYYNTTSWANTATDFCPFGLVLDTDTPFAARATTGTQRRIMLVSEDLRPAEPQILWVDKIGK